jgi:3-oxoacyl-[acyl-carrier-protein] synthase-1
MAQPKLFVTSMGANTPLGSTVTTCACVRAGVRRSTALDREVADTDEGQVPVIGHPVLTASGVRGETRLLALATPALREVMYGAAPASMNRVGLYLALPDMAARAKICGEAPPTPIGLLERLCAAVDLPGNPPVVSAFPHGPSGFAAALKAAATALAAGEVEGAIVGAVDSLCDDLALDALAAEMRLKGGDTPVGLEPGEGAAFLLLSADARAAAGRSSLGTVSGVGVAREPGQDAPTGRGWQEATANVVAACGSFPPGNTWFLIDLNGEERRAHDWGRVQIALKTSAPGLLPAPEWYPAAAFGDTGAAGAALAIQIAIRAFERGYAPAACAAILTSGDDGSRAVIRVERAS